MKFTAILPFAVTALAAVTRRQANQVAPALDAITDATNNLNTQVVAFSGDITDVATATQAVLTAISNANDVVSNIDDDQLGVGDAVGLVGPTNDLNAAVKTAIDSTIAQRDAFDAAGLRDTVLQSLIQQQDASAQLTDNIVRALDPALKDLGRQNAQPAADDLARGIAAFQPDDTTTTTTATAPETTTTTMEPETTTTELETTTTPVDEPVSPTTYPTEAPVYPTEAPVYPTEDAPTYPVESAYPSKEAPVYETKTLVTYCPAPTTLTWYTNTVTVAKPTTVTLTYVTPVHEAPVYETKTLVTYCPAPTTVTWYTNTVTVAKPTTVTMTYVTSVYQTHPTAPAAPSASAPPAYVSPASPAQPEAPVSTPSSYPTAGPEAPVTYTGAASAVQASFGFAVAMIAVAAF